MIKNCLLFILSCLLVTQALGQTKEESEEWLLRKLNNYGYRPIEILNAEGEVITPLTQWSLVKGRLEITCKKTDKRKTVLKYLYSVPIYAVDSVGYNDGMPPTKPARFLRLYLNCKCAKYTYHEIVSGGGFSEDRVGKNSVQDLYMIGNEEKDIKDRLNKAFDKLKEYYPKPKETF